MHKDIFGRVIEVGDVVGWTCSSSAVSYSMVTQILPKTVRIGGGGTIPVYGIVVLNDQMEASGKGDELLKLREEYRDQFVYDKPRPASKKSSYSVIFLVDPDTKEVFVRAIKLVWNDTQEQAAAYRDAIKKLQLDGFVMGDAREYYQFIWQKRGLFNVSSGYRYHQYDLKLMDVKALNLDAYIDQNVPYEAFKMRAGSVFNGANLRIDYLK